MQPVADSFDSFVQERSVVSQAMPLAREAPNPQGFPPQDGRKIIVQKIGSYWILTMVTVSFSKPT
jgi:hypothetical protein